jgi:TRAP-type C4-dicarboxylate transport system permease small subunit
MERKSSRIWLAAQANRLGLLIEMVSGTLCVLFFATMVSVMLVGVFFRYVLNNPFDWTEELARWLWLALSFLAINIAVRRNEHFGLDFITKMLPASVAKGLDYLVDLLTALFLVVLIRQAYFMALNTIMTGGALRISMFWPYLSLVVGVCFAFIQLVLRFIQKVVPLPEATSR